MLGFHRGMAILFDYLNSGGASIFDGTFDNTFQ